jgi:hypothetical protein
MENKTSKSEKEKISELENVENYGTLVEKRKKGWNTLENIFEDRFVVINLYLCSFFAFQVNQLFSQPKRSKFCRIISNFAFGLIHFAFITQLYLKLTLFEFTSLRLIVIVVYNSALFCFRLFVVWYLRIYWRIFNKMNNLMFCDIREISENSIYREKYFNSFETVIKNSSKSSILLRYFLTFILILVCIITAYSLLISPQHGTVLIRFVYTCSGFYCCVPLAFIIFFYNIYSIYIQRKFQHLNTFIESTAKDPKLISIELLELIRIWYKNLLKETEDFDKFFRMIFGVRFVSLAITIILFTEMDLFYISDPKEKGVWLKVLSQVAFLAVYFIKLLILIYDAANITEEARLTTTKIFELSYVERIDDKIDEQQGLLFKVKVRY